MASEPRRDWSGKELADRLGVQSRNMLTQLAEWTRLGFLAKTGPGQVRTFRVAQAGHSLSTGP